MKSVSVVVCFSPSPFSFTIQVQNRPKSSFSGVTIRKSQEEIRGEKMKIPDLDNLFQKSLCKIWLRNAAIFGGKSGIEKYKIFFKGRGH